MQALLDFEEPIADLLEQLEKVRAIEEKGEVDVSKTIKELQRKIKDERKDIFSDLTPWLRVQTSRHPDRPYGMKMSSWL